MTSSSRMRVSFIKACCVACLAAYGDILGPPDAAVTVVNTRSDTVAVFVWDLEATHLVDPYPGPVARGAFELPTIAPGASERVPVSEISAYRRGAALRIFVWRLHNDSLRLDSSVDWSVSDQRRTQYRLGLLAPTY